MLLRQIVPTGSNIGNGFEGQGLIIHDDAFHHLLDDGEDLAVHHHLGIRPDPAAVQEAASQQHIGHEDKLRGNVANQQRIGINTSVITIDEVRKLFPDLITEHFDYAAYEPDSGYADATLTTNSFIEVAKRNGATLIQNCEVTAIHTQGDKVKGVTTNKSDFDAPIIINAAGAWAKHVASLVGIEVPLETWTHVYLPL